MNRLVLLCSLLPFGTLNAAPYDFTYFQGGFAEGAYVQGQFSGEDRNNDGWLSYESGEIGNFSMLFSGNSWVNHFETQELVWFNFKFSKQTTWLGDDKGEIIYAGPFGPFGQQYTIDEVSIFYYGIYGEVIDCGYYCGTDFLRTYSYDLAQITAIPIANTPLPASIYLLFSGFLAVIFAKKKPAKISLMTRFHHVEKALTLGYN